MQPHYEIVEGINASQIDLTFFLVERIISDTQWALWGFPKSGTQSDEVEELKDYSLLSAAHPQISKSFAILEEEAKI